MSFDDTITSRILDEGNRREGERRRTERRSTVLNSAIRKAGGPNGITPLTVADALAVRAAVQRVADDENATLKACCESAASEIRGMIWNSFLFSNDPRKIEETKYAAVIYKHMRNGREL